MKLKTKESIDFYLGNFLIAINVVIARTLGFILRRDHTLKTPPGTIIITKLLGLGSLVAAADAILAIRKKYPKAGIYLICSSSIANEAKQLGLFDNVWVLDDASFSSLFTSSIKVLAESWKHKNKWVINLEVYSRLCTIFSLWTFAKNRFGFYFNQVKFRYLLNTHHVYFNTMGLAYDNYKEIAKAMDVEITEDYKIPLKPDQRLADNRQKYIAINNNCSELSKERKLTLEMVSAIIKELLEKYNYKIALIGSKADIASNETILGLSALIPFKDKIINVAGKYDFIEFLEFLKYDCVMLLTIDSGPIHFAYRLDMPTVSVWGPTNPDTLIPKSFVHEKIYLGVHCSPCVHHTDILPCRGNNFCIKNIEVKVILNAIDRTLN